MPKEKLKDWIKTWTVSALVDGIISEGMEFMARHDDKAYPYSKEQLKKYKRMMVREIKSRIII